MPEHTLENSKITGTAVRAEQRAVARDDFAFLLAAKRGDSAAFGVLCEQSANTIFHLALRIMRNREDAEDVVQESYQQAFIHLQSFNGDSRFSTWLSRIAINAALMKLRKKHHLLDVSLDEPTAEQASSRLDPEDQELDPEQLYAQNERQRILAAVIKTLTPRTRKAIELRDLDERSTEETAQIMGITVGAVKARVFHGRRKLREKLQQYVKPAWTSGRDARRTTGDTRHISQDQIGCNACG